MPYGYSSGTLGRLMRLREYQHSLREAGEVESGPIVLELYIMEPRLPEPYVIATIKHIQKHEPFEHSYRFKGEEATLHRDNALRVVKIYTPICIQRPRFPALV